MVGDNGGMIFQERKTETGYAYHTEDVFGTVDIDTQEKLDADILDDMVVFLLRQELSAKEVTGSVETEKYGTVQYRFVKADMWSDDEEKPCNDSPTSTNKQENANTAMSQFTTRIWNWCKRFVAAFQEAWRSANGK